METIKLGKEVVVSDPCYTIPTWCQAVIDNVKPGVYHTTVRKHKSEGWGNRCAMVFAIHEDYYNTPHLLIGNWEKTGYDIGVDSGQCGIFSKETYRNDSHDIEFGEGDVSFFNQEPWNSMNPKGTGEDWYVKMCSRTLGDKSWGVYDEGIVSSSGFGDGSYDLFVVKKYGKIVAFAIDFQVEDGKYIDFDYNNPGYIEDEGPTVDSAGFTEQDR
jgi:hypothetical protein